MAPPKKKADEMRTATGQVSLTLTEKAQLLRASNRASEKVGHRVTESDIIRDALVKAGVISKRP